MKHYHSAGWHTRGLVRKPRAEGEVAFSLGGEIAPGALAGVHTLVHAAYDFSPRRWPELEAVNVRGTARLVSAATAAGVKKVVLVSTISAFAGARSLYGCAKLECEKIALAHGALIVRPGLITGESEGGMVGSLRARCAGREFFRSSREAPDCTSSMSEISAISSFALVAIIWHCRFIR